MDTFNPDLSILLGTGIVSSSFILPIFADRIESKAILAKSLGLSYQGLGSKTKFYFYVSAIIREYVGIIHLNLRKNVLIATLIGLVYSFNYIK